LDRLGPKRLAVALLVAVVVEALLWRDDHDGVCSSVDTSCLEGGQTYAQAASSVLVLWLIVYGSWPGGAGQRNREVAQALFVTQKTVENHLGRVYSKLGIVSRSELGAALANSGGSRP